MKKVNKKLFTNDESKNIIKPSYNLLSKDYKKICKGERVFMNEDMILSELTNELSKKYNEKEQVIKNMLKKCKKGNYSIEKTKQLIKEFLLK